MVNDDGVVFLSQRVVEHDSVTQHDVQYTPTHTCQCQRNRALLHPHDYSHVHVLDASLWTVRPSHTCCWLYEERHFTSMERENHSRSKVTWHFTEYSTVITYVRSTSIFTVLMLLLHSHQYNTFILSHCLVPADRPTLSTSTASQLNVHYTPQCLALNW